MAYVVSSPGSCGELVQGYGWGSSFMITCPIDRYSCARSYLRASSGTLPEKSEQARIRTLQYLGKESAQIDICLASAIPVGKGMASSTADISAVCQATALACGSLLSSEEIAAIAISIEPSDGTFYPGIVQFDYRSGQIIKKLGTVPEARILVYDCGGKVDTLAFNVRKELIAMQKKNEAEIRPFHFVWRDSVQDPLTVLEKRQRSVLLPIRKFYIRKLWNLFMRPAYMPAAAG